MYRWQHRLSLVPITLALAGCAQGMAGPPDGVNGPAADGGALPDADDCAPPCAEGQSCVAGVCVVPVADADGDGVPQGDDCDDADATVGGAAERPCSSACGSGVERCTAGEWHECTAPAECACTDGDGPRVIECGMCGEQRQVCVDGRWVDDGECDAGVCSPGAIATGGACGRCGVMERLCLSTCAWDNFVCTGEGACTPGTVDTETESCGDCAAGVRTRTRTCSDACGWGAWGDWSECTTAAGCTPGEAETQSRDCGTCGGGTQERTRSCDPSSCTWGAWGDWGTCSGDGSCCGDGVCDATESCSSCGDCQAGHLGTGEGGDSCAGVPDEQWRCVTAPSFGTQVSQVCRGGIWVNYHLSPADCAACVCSYSSACE